MAIPKNVLKAAEQSAQTLDRLMLAFDNQLLEAIKDVERKAIMELKALDLDKSGNIVKSQANLNRAMNARIELVRFAEKEIGVLAENWANTFDQVAEFAVKNLASSGIDVAFTQIDGRLLEVFKELSVIDLKSGVNFVFQDMGRTLMSETLVGGNFNDLVKKIQGRLTTDLLAAGEEIPVGKSLAAQARRIGHDTLMDTYRSLHTKKAKDAGITRFLYFGTVVADTREFCAERVGKIFTDEEIDSWNDLEYKGKIPGLDVRIGLGGFNCRHSLTPIPEAIGLEDLGITQEEETEAEAANG